MRGHGLCFLVFFVLFRFDGEFMGMSWNRCRCSFLSCLLHCTVGNRLNVEIENLFQEQFWLQVFRHLRQFLSLLNSNELLLLSCDISHYSRTSVARTLMARFPRLFRTRS